MKIVVELIAYTLILSGGASGAVKRQ